MVDRKCPSCGAELLLIKYELANGDTELSHSACLYCTTVVKVKEIITDIKEEMAS